MYLKERYKIVERVDKLFINIFSNMQTINTVSYVLPSFTIKTCYFKTLLGD